MFNMTRGYVFPWNPKRLAVAAANITRRAEKLIDLEKIEFAFPSAREHVAHLR